MKNTLTTTKLKSPFGVTCQFITSGLSVLLLIGTLVAAPRVIRADAVTDWNQTTLATQNALAGIGAIRTPPAGRALAMVHASIYDSVNAIYRQYGVYAVDMQPPTPTSPEAATAAAAHKVLVNLYPSQQA